MSTPFFNGTGATYFTISPLDSARSYPFAVSMWVKLQRYPGGTPDIYTFFSSALPDMTVGTFARLEGGLPRAYARDGVNTDFGGYASPDEWLLSEPYWDHVLFEYRSASDRRIYINGTQDLGGTVTASRPLSFGSTPVFRIGIDSAGTYPFFGNIAHVSIVTGPLNDTDRNLLANSDHGTGLPTLTAGAIVNHYELDGDGNDSVGTDHLTVVGSMVYQTGYPDHANRNSVHSQHPTRGELIQWTHKTNHLHTELPTVVPGQASPVSTSGWTNLASVEWFNISFTTANAQAGSCRGFHYIPTVGSQDHCVFINNGHAGTSDWNSYDTSLMIKDLLADGFGVYAYTMPHYGDVDTGVEFTGHPQWETPSGTDANISDTFNALEVFYAPIEIAMNNLVNRYGKRSHIGLSGGAWTGPNIGAHDIRFNHCVVADRGSLPDRRNGIPKEFEACPYPNGWKQEELWYLAGDGNRRLWILAHPGDFPYWQGAKLDLDITNFDAKFFAPIRAKNPFADVQFKTDTGAGTSSTHKFYQSTYDDIFFPALTGTLMTAYSADLVRTGVYFQPQAFTHDGTGFTDDMFGVASITNLAHTASVTLTEAADSASVTARVRDNAAAAMVEANDSISFHALVRSGTYVAATEANDVANFHAKVKITAHINVTEADDNSPINVRTGHGVTERLRDVSDRFVSNRYARVN